MKFDFKVGYYNKDLGHAFERAFSVSSNILHISMW